MNSPNDLKDVLSGVGAVLLDFDGPVCSVFASTPANQVAARLKRVLCESGVELPAAVQGEDDPLAVLRYTGGLGNNRLTLTVDDTLRTAELAAIEGAQPTPNAEQLIKAIHGSGRWIAIVSNNSAAVIDAYLGAHHMAHYVARVVGRERGEPTKMKPSPQPIELAIAGLAVRPAACALIGDSTSDVEAARRAGVRVVGYANKPGKKEALSAAGPDAIVEGTEGLAALARHFSHGTTYSRR